MTNSDSIRATNKSETQQDRTRKTGAVEPTDRSRLDPRRSRQKMVCMMIAEPRRRPSGPGPPSGSRAPHENQEPRKERGGRQDTRSRRGRRVKGRAGWEELKAGRAWGGGGPLGSSEAKSRSMGSRGHRFIITLDHHIMGESRGWQSLDTLLLSSVPTPVPLSPPPRE